MYTLLIVPHFSSIAQDREYVLDLRHPENNHGEIFAIVGKEVQVGEKGNEEIVDKMVIMLPIPDFHDYKEKKYKASLLSDRSGVIITKPTVPNFLIQAVPTIYKLEGEAACSAMMRAHQIAAVSIQEMESKQTRQVVYKFPEGMTCNTRFFNDKEGELKLANTYRMLRVIIRAKSGTKEEVSQLCQMVRWEMAIDGQTRRLLTKKSDDEDDILDSAMHRMSLMSD
jgi:hypothetical protein